MHLQTLPNTSHPGYMENIAQPIHPDILARLDPEYAAFHNQHLKHTIPVHLLPWNASIRDTPAVPGGSEPLAVGEIKDFSLPTCKARTFTPEGPAPSNGWPVLIYFHGGDYPRIPKKSSGTTSTISQVAGHSEILKARRPSQPTCATVRHEC